MKIIRTSCESPTSPNHTQPVTRNKTSLFNTDTGISSLTPSSFYFARSVNNLNIIRHVVQDRLIPFTTSPRDLLDYYPATASTW